MVKYSIEVQGKAVEVREHILELRDALDVIIKQDYAQVGFLDDAAKGAKYCLGIEPNLNGLALVIPQE